MEILFLKVGKPAFKEFSSLTDEYSKRLTRFVRFSSQELKESESKEKTYKTVSKITQGSHLICFDEMGQKMTSQSIASRLEEFKSDSRVKRIVFLVGGPYGIEKSVLESASEVWRLSECTLTSDMAWLLAIEQIYRGLNILKGTGYHHGGAS